MQGIKEKKRVFLRALSLKGLAIRLQRLKLIHRVTLSFCLISQSFPFGFALLSIFIFGELLFEVLFVFKKDVKHEVLPLFHDYFAELEDICKFIELILIQQAKVMQSFDDFSNARLL